LEIDPLVEQGIVLFVEGIVLVDKLDFVDLGKEFGNLDFVDKEDLDIVLEGIVEVGNNFDTVVVV